MKKVLIGITAAVCTAVMCFGFAACGAGFGSVNKASAKNIKSIQVTEDEWNAAFEYFEREDATYSIEFALENTETYLGRSIADLTGRGNCRVKDGKVYVKTEAEASGEEFPEDFAQEYVAEKNREEYGVYEDGIYYIYSKNEEGKWEKNVGGNRIAQLNNAFAQAANFSPISENNFTEWEYSAEEKGYAILAFNTGYFSPTCVFKFGKVGGEVRVVAAYLHLHMGEQGDVATIEESFIINYTNVADITLPDVD